MRAMNQQATRFIPRDRFLLCEEFLLCDMLLTMLRNWQMQQQPGSHHLFLYTKYRSDKLSYDQKYRALTKLSNQNINDATVHIVKHPDFAKVISENVFYTPEELAQRLGARQSALLPITPELRLTKDFKQDLQRTISRRTLRSENNLRFSLVRRH